MAQCVPRLSAVQPAGDEMPLAVRPTRPEERRWRGLATCACALQGALTVVLIAIVAWLGATVRDQRATLDALQAPGVMFTVGQPVVSGYRQYGSLYRGSGAWVVKPTLLPGGGLSDHGAAAVGDFVYIFGGTNQGQSNAPLSGAMTSYDTIYETFDNRTLPPMPVPYTRFAYAANADSIYIVGGIGGDVGVGNCWNDTACSPNSVMMATAADVQNGNPGRTGGLTWAFNVTTSTWRSDAALAAARLNVPRSDACAAVINGLLYVVGGYSDFYNITDSLEVLNPSAPAPVWRSLAPLPAPRGDLACAVVNGQLLVFGGYYDPFCTTVGCFNSDPLTGGDPRAGAGAVDGVSNFRTDTWLYDPASNAWSVRAPMRYVRGDAAAVALPGGRVMVAGGERNLRTTAVKVPQHSVEIYHVTEDSWAEKAPMPFARFRFAAAAVGLEAHAFGGQGVCTDTDAAAIADGMAACQDTAAATHSVLFELDHPAVFVQLPLSAGSGLVYDQQLEDALYVAATNATAAAGRHRRAALR